MIPGGMTDVVDTHFIYGAGGEHAGAGVTGLANRSAALLALA